MGEVKILMLHHGISPWELEVAYGIFAKKFIVEQKDIETTTVMNMLAYLRYVYQ